MVAVVVRGVEPVADADHAPRLLHRLAVRVAVDQRRRGRPVAGSRSSQLLLPQPRLQGRVPGSQRRRRDRRLSLELESEFVESAAGLGVSDGSPELRGSRELVRSK